MSLSHNGAIFGVAENWNKEEKEEQNKVHRELYIVQREYRQSCFFWRNYVYVIAYVIFHRMLHRWKKPYWCATGMGEYCWGRQPHSSHGGRGDLRYNWKWIWCQWEEALINLRWLFSIFWWLHVPEKAACCLAALQTLFNELLRPLGASVSVC